MKKAFQLVLFIIVFVGVYIGFDFLYAKFITQSAFEFNPGTDLIVPSATAITVGLLVVQKGKKGSDK